MLVVNNQLEGDVIQFRESMRKFQLNETTASAGCALRSLGLVEWSKPSESAQLNRQLIVLLSALNIPDNLLLWKQRQAFAAEIGGEDFTRDPFGTIKWLSLSGQKQRALQLLRGDRIVATATRKSKQQRKSDNETENKDRLRVKIPFSRQLFGVCDQSNKLDEGQCFVRITIDGRPRTLSNGHVMVARNPCYHIGDIRKLQVVSDIPELSHLCDCIVFPTRGARPHPDEMAGGDLDGDKYFVCWDPDLLAFEPVAPFDYSTPETRTTSKPENSTTTKSDGPSHEDMIRYDNGATRHNM